MLASILSPQLCQMQEKWICHMKRVKRSFKVFAQTQNSKRWKCPLENVHILLPISSSLDDFAAQPWLLMAGPAVGEI
jgi:hypothetical protein